MSIAVERFAAEKMYLTYDPYAEDSGEVSVFCLQCRHCGFEIDDVAHTPHEVCPKCHGNAWERFVRPGSLLRVADGQPQPVPDPEILELALAGAR